MEDVFDDNVDNVAISRRDWDHMQENRVKEGYKEGISAGQESKLQEGFDDGYQQSVKQAYHLARMRGILCAILVTQNQIDPGSDPQKAGLLAQAKDLMEDISNIETEIFKTIQQPSNGNAMETPIPGPQTSASSVTTRTCCKETSSDSDSCDCKKNFNEKSTGREDPSGFASTKEDVVVSEDILRRFSKDVERVREDMIMILKRLDFGSAFISTI